MKQILYCVFLFTLGLPLVSCSKKNLFDPALTSGDKTALPQRGMVNLSAPPNDPFAPYLTSTPTLQTTVSTTNSGSGTTAITTKRFTFLSKGGVNTVFAIMAYPQAAGTYPAIMFNHGGGGNAETMAGNVNTYAALGYVTIAIDEPGIASTTTTPYSSGPWKSAAAGEGPRLNVAGGAQNSTLLDAGVAGIEAFNYLKAQPNVNVNKMAISGVSWGGYMTTMLSGILGSQVKAAYSIFGCGYYDLGTFWTNLLAAMSAADRTTWETYLDAGRRASGITAPYFIEEPTDDTYFWPEAVSATLNAIPGTKNRVFMPNLNHTEFAQASNMKQTYLNYYLKGVGSPFGSASISSSALQSDGSMQITVNTVPASGTSVSAVRLYYSAPTSTWQTAHWDSIAAPLVSSNVYRATLSSTQVNQNMNYYASMVDSRNVITSTSMYQTGYLDHCDATTGWTSGNTLTVNTTDKKENTGSLQSVGASTSEFIKVFTPYNSGVSAATGSIQFWYYVSDVSKFGAGDQIEVGSGGAADVNEYSWSMGTVVNGWNLITKTFATAGITGGTPNLNAINWFRIYHVKTASITTKVDGIQILP